MSSPLLLNPIESAHTRLENLAETLLGQPLNMTTFDKTLAKRSLPFSDVNASDVLVDKIHNVVCYIALQKKWYVWNGIVHTPLENDSSIQDLVERFAHALDDATDFVKEWYRQAIAAQIQLTGAQSQAVKDLREELSKTMFGKTQTYCDRLHNTAGQMALFQMLTRKLTVDVSYFEDDARYLVFENTVLDVKRLRRGEGWHFYDHDESRHVTRYFKASYTGDASKRSVDWEEKFLAKSLPDEETRRFLQKVVGCAFMGVPKLKVIPNLSGPANSGKSLFVSVINKLGAGGAGYSGMPSPDALLQDGDFSARDELRGRRFVAITEPDPDKKLDAEFVKQVSGGDQMATRQLYGNYVSWMPECVMFIASNQPVRFNTWDDALLNRVALVDFPNAFYHEEEGGDPEFWIDEGLEDRIVENDAEGVLLWIIQGMQAYIAEGLKQPDAVKKNRTKARDETNQTYRWLTDWINDGRIIELSEDEVKTAGLSASDFIEYKVAYRLFCTAMKQEGEKPMQMRRFGADIKKRYGLSGWARSGSDRIPNLKWGQNYLDGLPTYEITDLLPKTDGSSAFKF